MCIAVVATCHAVGLFRLRAALTVRLLHRWRRSVNSALCMLGVCVAGVHAAYGTWERATYGYALRGDR